MIICWFKLWFVIYLERSRATPFFVLNCKIRLRQKNTKKHKKAKKKCKKKKFDRIDKISRLFIFKTISFAVFDIFCIKWYSIINSQFCLKFVWKYNKIEMIFPDLKLVKGLCWNMQMKEKVVLGSFVWITITLDEIFYQLLKPKPKPKPKLLFIINVPPSQIVSYIQTLSIVWSV